MRDLEIDQDTQGVPGSPPIAETILAKIDVADIFVADLTFANEAERSMSFGPLHSIKEVILTSAPLTERSFPP